ncbi:hypothetical protein ACHAXR_003114 [Thalassiosira sp. AJA248-18]
MQYHLALSALAVVFSKSSAFITPRPQNNGNRFTVGSSRNDGEGDPLFFDDFGDGSFGDGSSSSSNDNGNLSSRISQVKGAEEAYDAKLARNWRRGNWSVRGFALHKTSFAKTDTSEKPAHVSVVAAPSSSFTSISLPQDRALPESRSVAVGRTDGSVFVVKLGDEYLTSFMSVPKLVMEQEENEGQIEGDDEAGMTVRVENEWMDSNELKDRLQEEQTQMAQSPMGEEEGGDQIAQKQNPFEITHQFLASDYPINSLVFHDVIEGENCSGIICTAAGISGEISMWKLPSSDQKHIEMQPQLLSGVHCSQIVSLETMVLQDGTKEQNVLFSASRDGKIALWDLDRNGELVFSCQCTDVENESTVSLTCADVSNPSSWDDDYNGYGNSNGLDVIYLGTSNGYVMGYLLNDLLTSLDSNGDSISECPVPNLHFRAHGTDSGKGEAVTAIKCGGDGTIPTSARLQGADENEASSSTGRSPRISSSILLTGGEDGSVKQWEILSQKASSSASSIRMDHWPRLSTQRMKRRSHLFSPGHDGAVSSISQQGRDSSKFLTCSEDGSVCVWSASSGKELFRMDGFSNKLSSLACLGRELLVTDGMEGCVCVHDFGIEEDAASNGYDLEW